MKTKILVMGGTGKVGSRVTRLLLERGLEPRLLVRSAERVLPNGVVPVTGDIRNEASIRAALRGIDRLFLITPHSPTEAQEGIAAVRAAMENGVERVVYLSAHQADVTPHGIPHVDSKKEVRRALEESGLQYTIVAPNNFFQNDEEWFAGGLQAGVYAQPIGSIGLSRVDADDIAVAVTRVLLEDGHHGRVYGLVGPEVLNGERSAAIWSAALGREIRYAGHDLNAFANAARAALPEWLVEDLVAMYAYFQAHGVAATEQDLADTRMLLGREPRSFASYAKEAAATWARLAA